MPRVRHLKALAARAAMAPLQAVVAAAVVFDELARPLYGPVVRWVATLRVTAALQRGVARLPPYAILVLLAVPYAAVEPLKLVGLYWMGTGHFALGLVTEILAHAATFLLIERIYDAGRDKLLTIGWFAAAMGFVVRIRDAVLARLRATRAWMLARQYALRAKAAVARLARR